MEWSEEELVILIDAVKIALSIETVPELKYKYTVLLVKLREFQELECD